MHRSRLFICAVALLTASCTGGRALGPTGEATPPEVVLEAIPSEVIPVRRPPHIRLIEYPPVSMAEREGHFIELVEDLVIAERDDDRQYDFDDAVDLAVDERDNLYVHDNGRYRIVVYSPGGSFARVYGGAGEMAPFRLGWISIAGEKLAISTGNKITVWTLDGEHLYDRSLLRRALGRPVEGTVSGNLVGFFEMLDRDRELWYRIERISLDEDDSYAYGAVPTRRRERASPPARAGFAATRDGAAYLTAGDEYRVQAFDANGDLRWVLRVDWPRSASAEGPPAPALANRGCSLCPLDRIGRGNPVRTDGRGNLYVFPFVDDDWDRNEVPVDVYSPVGERLFAGFIADVSWLRAKDDAIYGIEYDAAADRQRVVRRRIAGPPSVVAGGAR